MVMTDAKPALLGAAAPWTWTALCQAPFTWADHERLRTGEAIGVVPPAPQLPADRHETESTSALPPLLRAAVPGTTNAARHLPLTSLTTYACGNWSGVGDSGVIIRWRVPMGRLWVSMTRASKNVRPCLAAVDR